jgi:hypothetical protein
MMVVQIQKPANMTLAVWFSELRSWLDENQCELGWFSRSGRIMDAAVFDLAFKNDAHARLFASNFKNYASSVRRAFVTERLDFLARESQEGSIADEAADLSPIEEKGYEPANSFEPNPSRIAR